MSRKSEVELVETTIGDLIEAITQIALESGKTETEGYHLAALTIESILNRRYTAAREELPVMN